jgi:hypothetical protein
MDISAQIIIITTGNYCWIYEDRVFGNHYVLGIPAVQSTGA